jgi:hypothetical protein
MKLFGEETCGLAVGFPPRAGKIQINTEHCRRLCSADVKHVTFDRRIQRYPLDAAGTIPGIEDRHMTTRRMAYWWLRFVVSGRFIEKFLNLRRLPRS